MGIFGVHAPQQFLDPFAGESGTSHGERTRPNFLPNHW